MRETRLELEAEVGQRIIVPVKDMPSAGYLWALSGLSELVTLESANRMHVPSDDLPASDRPYGGERPKEFYLWARRAGEALLTFELLRPFEPEEPAEILTVSIKITARAPRAAPAPFGAGYLDPFTPVA